MVAFGATAVAKVTDKTENHVLQQSELDHERLG
jgi:hypothetical protein